MTAEPRTRAQPMQAEDRKAMIVDAVIPLLLEHGRSVTSRQIAEAAGIAEGTIFRAFGDKETLVAAAVERFLDPLSTVANLRAIDLDLTLDDKLRAMIGILRDRFTGVIRMMRVMSYDRPPPHREVRHEMEEVITELLGPHAAELSLSPERVTNFVRMIAFASAIPAFGESVDFTDDELADLLKHGVMHPPTTTRKKN